MSDLIERLERWGKDEGLQNHFIGSRSARKDCAEAAATIARQQVMLDRALEASFDDKARADRAEEENARLRDALAPCAAILAQQRLPEGREYLIGGAFRVTVGEALDKANAALA